MQIFLDGPMFLQKKETLIRFLILAVVPGQNYTDIQSKILYGVHEIILFIIDVDLYNLFRLK